MQVMDREEHLVSAVHWLDTTSALTWMQGCMSLSLPYEPWVSSEQGPLACSHTMGEAIETVLLGRV